VSQDVPREQFVRWTEAYYQDVYRWCYRYCGHHDTACDLTQETFLMAYTRMDQFRQESSPKTWLLTIATRLYLRRAKRDRRMVPLGFGPAADAATAQTSPQKTDDEAIERIDRQLLWQYVYTLRPNERIAVYLFYGEELSYEEVALAMNASVVQVRNYLHRGRTHLRKLISEKGGL